MKNVHKYFEKLRQQDAEKSGFTVTSCELRIGVRGGRGIPESLEKTGFRLSPE